MFSTIKKILIALVILTIVMVAGLYLYSLDRTYFNDEEVVGNTAGNIYNGGLFCERDGKIYFSNDNADGALYVMNSDCTNVKPLRKDKAVYINVDENYIYYVRANYTRENDAGSILMFRNTGVFRVKRNGDNLMAFTGNPGAYLMLKGNHIYFQRYDAGVGLYLYRYQIDGKLERLLYEDAVIPSAVINNNLYFAGYSKDHDINRLDLDSFNTRTVFEGSFLYPIFTDKYIYYMDYTSKYRIYRMNLDGSDPTLLVDEKCSTYNITNSGKYLYYQVDNGKNNRICRLNLESMEEETLMDGNYKQIHVTDRYVFFKDFEETKTYVLFADGNSDISIFNPPGTNEEK